MLLVNHALQRLLKRHVTRQRKYVGTRNHDLAHRDVLQIDRAMDHLLLRRGQHSQSAAGSDDQLQLFPRVHSALTHLTHPEGFQYRPSRSGHESQERRRDRHEDIHRPGDCQRDLLGPLQGDRLGDDLAQNDVQISNESERHGYGDSVRIKAGVGQRKEQRLQHAGHGSLAYPAQGEAGNRHSKLYRVEYVIELLMELLDGARADTVRRNHLLQSRLPDAHQGEFSGHEERVRRDEQDHRYDAQQSECNHEAEILSSARWRKWASTAGELERFQDAQHSPNLTALLSRPRTSVRVEGLAVTS